MRTLPVDEHPARCGCRISGFFARYVLSAKRLLEADEHRRAARGMPYAAHRSGFSKRLAIIFVAGKAIVSYLGDGTVVNDSGE
jgi:hypothetical protein